jgi:bisanhydrobacterioruberin hydratase
MKKIAIVIVVSLLLMFVATGNYFYREDFEQYTLVANIALVVFALPSYYFLIKLIGKKWGSIIILILCIYAVMFESIAIKTHFPYGEFHYGTYIGYKLFDRVPIMIGFAWSHMILGAYYLAIRIVRGKVYLGLIIATILLVLVDMVLDPGAVASGYWYFTGPSFLYNVPLSNFLGWVVSGIFGNIILWKLLNKSNTDYSEQSNKYIMFSLFMTLVYWTTIVFWYQLYISVLLGIILIGLIVNYWVEEKYRLIR